MERWKRILRKLLFPKWQLVLLSVPLAAAGLTYAFTGNRQEQWVAVPIYVFSFCALTWVCALVGSSAGRWKREIAGVIDRTPVVKRYLTDVSFSMNVSLYRSLGLNGIYAVWKLWIGVRDRSAWFVTLAVYYLLLAVMRFSLLRYFARNAYGENQREEWKRYRLCGILLLVMSIALTCMVILVVLRNEGFHYAGYLIYVMALYAFYSITMAIRNVVKYRKYRSPVMWAAKALQLAAALVSMLALETAMLSAFGGNDTAQSRMIMTGCTGAGVCAIVLGIAVYMIRRSTKAMKEETI